MLAPELTVALVATAVAGERQATRELVDALTPVVQMRDGVHVCPPSP